MSDTVTITVTHIEPKKHSTRFTCTIDQPDVKAKLDLYWPKEWGPLPSTIHIQKG